MSNMINFGIDLGTTNSLIAKFNAGAIEVFKNPRGFKESLPSAVSFRKGVIHVGEKARTYATRDPLNVCTLFKRKMGTTEAFRIPSLGQTKTPIELSAEVLKELKTFIHTGETPEAAVITIPASFDTRQTIATEEAAHAAGFSQVLLLQEPIAASLAYANSDKNRELAGSQWIVYDLGGGTFDVALVQVSGGELDVVDHEGDNYLGGTDFDALIVERLIVPELERLGTFDDLISEMKSESGRYNSLWFKLLQLAEEAKIELSHSTFAEVDFEADGVIEDDLEDTIDGCMKITRSDFESLIRDAVESSVDMIKRMLTRNSLSRHDLKFVLMVGGSTYIPYVRTRIGELLELPVVTDIDPTNAIVVGAAYYAGTKELQLDRTDQNRSKNYSSLKIRVTYERATREDEELFAARIDGDVSDLFYRITRADGGYDSGLKELSARIQEDLPIQENAYNNFEFRIYDDQSNLIHADIAPIQIAHGTYIASGQMLPEDVCLKLDDARSGGQTLEVIFPKNTVLPARRTMSVEASKTLLPETDDRIDIMVYEGLEDVHPDAAKMLGHLLISAGDLDHAINMGEDIGLVFEMSESRTLKVTVDIVRTGKTRVEVFQPEWRNVETLDDEIENLETRIEQAKNEAIESQNYELAKKLDGKLKTVWELQEASEELPDDSVTDERYKLDDRKRDISKEVHQLTSGQRLELLRDEYHSAKADAKTQVNENGNDSEKRSFQMVIEHEPTFLHSSDLRKIEARIGELKQIEIGILRRTPEFILGAFEYLCSRVASFNDPTQAKVLIESGRRAVEDNDLGRLDEVNVLLFPLLPRAEQDSDEGQRFNAQVGIRR